MAVCAMAEALYAFELLANGEGGPVQSVSIGSVSASYGSAAGQSLDLSPRRQEKELYRCPAATWIFTGGRADGPSQAASPHGLPAV